MCKKKKTPKVEAPYIPAAPAAPPPPEAVAEAPVISDERKERQGQKAKKKGTAALRIELQGGTSPLKAGGLSIPK